MMSHTNSASSIRKRRINNSSKAISKGRRGSQSTKMMTEPDSSDIKSGAQSLKQPSNSWMISAIVVVAAIVLVVAVVAPVDETIITTVPSRSHHRRVVVTSSTRTQRGTFRLIQTVSHDSNAFTQGLVTVYDPSDQTLKFYEGTGVNGQSQLRLVNIDTGTVVAQHSLPFRYFGEGITHYLDSSDSNLSRLRIIQITWREQTAFEYDIQSNTTSTLTSSTGFSSWLTRVQKMVRNTRFCRRRQRLLLCRLQNSTVNADDTPFSTPLTVPEPYSTLQYETTTSEGWGVTYSKENHQLYVSDGSAYLHTWDVATKKEITKVSVTYQYSDMDAPMSMNRLNELEYDPVTNTILANVWLTNMIVRIDIATGFILTIYDFSSLYTDRITEADVFNGIALTYDAINNNNTTGIQTDQIWVTGKYWPNMYRVQLIDP